MFTDLGLVPAILEALRADGYERPTPIQAQSIPPALAKRDVLGIAQTGTGKTAAFALPIIQRLVTELRPGVKLPVGRKPKALVLAPTRELAAQIAESFASYGRHTPVRFAVIFGGVGQGPQVRAIQQGIDILVATPGRLIDLLQQRLVNLSEISFFVLDEADRMLDMGFIEPIRKISALLPRERQTMLYSATMPKEIRHLADALLRDPVTVTVTPVSSAVDRIDQKLYFVLKAQKTQLMIHLFDTLGMERAVVFTKTKHGADRLARKLKAAGIGSEAIHGNKAQNQRIRALDAFRSGRSPVLVATDVAARGLDIDDVTHVVNYDLPMEPEAYVHRIGRTARAGKSGHAISFCDVEERGLLKQVERLIKFEIPRERVPEEVPKSDEVAAKTVGLKGTPESTLARSADRENQDGRHDTRRPDERRERDRGERSRGESSRNHGDRTRNNEAMQESRAPHAPREHRGNTHAHPSTKSTPKPHAKSHSHAKPKHHPMARDTRHDGGPNDRRSTHDGATSDRSNGARPTGGSQTAKPQSGKPPIGGGRRSQWTGRPRGR
jgi:ATP-dependent RNA helicase RhlE